MKAKKINLLFDGASLLIIAAVALTLVIEPIFTNITFDDLSYHVMVGQQFAEIGGVVTHDFWESLPDGRAHLYPPVIHTIIAALVIVGLSPVALLTITPIASIVGLLLLSWFGLKKLFNSAVGFFYLMVAVNFIAFIIFSGVIIPASFVIAATPLLLYLLINKKIIGATALLTILLYTHMILPWLVIISLLIWLLFNRDYVKTTIPAIVGAVILYAPWLIHIIISQNYIKYLNGQSMESFQQQVANINLTIVVFFITALFYLVWQWRKQWHATVLFFLIFLAVQFPLTITAVPNRFFASGGYFAMAVVIAFALHRLLEKKSVPYAPIMVAIIVVGLNFGFYQIWIDQAQDDISARWVKAHFLQTIQYKQLPPNDILRLQAGAFSPANQALAQAINQNSEPDQPLQTTFNIFLNTLYDKNNRHVIAQVFSALSQRPKVNPREPEVNWITPLAVAETPIIVATRDQTLLDGPNNQEWPELAAFLNQEFTVVAEEGNIVVLKNNNPNTFRVVYPPVVFPLPLAWALLLLLTGITIYSVVSVSSSKNSSDTATS